MVESKRARAIMVAIALALYVAWLIVYLQSLDLHGRNFDCENYIFDADGTRLIKMMTVPLTTYSANRHPLYLAFLKPIGLTLNSVMGDPIAASLLGTAALATVAVPFAFLLLRRTARGVIDGLLWTLLFAGSGSIWLFAAMPETFAINAASIVLGYVLQLLPRGELYAPKAFRKIFVLHVLFGVFAMGMTLTNSVYAFISFTSLVWKHRPTGPGAKWKRFMALRLAIYVVSVTLLVSWLSLAQGVSYPGAYRFGAPQGYTGVAEGDAKYVTTAHMGSWLLTEGRTFIGNSIVAPHAEQTDVMMTQFGKKPEKWPVIQFSSDPGWMWWTCAAGMLAFIGALAWRARKPAAAAAAGEPVAAPATPSWRPEIAMSIAVIGFNLLLHSFYRAIGAPVMYTVHVVFPIVFLLSLLYGRSALRGKRILLAVLVLGVLATNASFLGDVNDALRNGNPKPFRVPPEGRVVGKGPGK